MCMNCGCGQLDTRHQDSDIVQDDIRKAADGQGMSTEETVQNLESSLQQVRSDPTTQSGASTSRY